MNMNLRSDHGAVGRFAEGASTRDRSAPRGRIGAGSRRQRAWPGGFTLVEILIVIIILGVLAAIVVPRFNNASTDAKRATCANELKQMARLFQIYEARYGGWPADAVEGVLPPEANGIVDLGQFESATPMGGRWDWDRDQFGVHAGLSIYRPTATEEEMQELDRTVDDGNLATGKFRARPDGYIFVLDP